VASLHHKIVFTVAIPLVSSGCTTAVIGSVVNFNSDFVENRCKSFTAVLMEKPPQNHVNSGSYGKNAAKRCLQRFCS
jgi:hypothetical protein